MMMKSMNGISFNKPIRNYNSKSTPRQRNKENINEC